MTSYTPEGLASYWERGARLREAQARKLEATVQKWKTRDDIRAVARVADEWKSVAKNLEDCACSIEKHFLNALLAEVRERMRMIPEWESETDNITLANSREACMAATCKVEAKAHEWEGKVGDLRARARTWRDKANALLGDPEARARLLEAEIHEWEEKASDLKARAQKLRAFTDEWVGNATGTGKQGSCS